MRRPIDDLDKKTREQIANLRIAVEMVNREGLDRASPLSLALLWERSRHLVEMLDGKPCCTT